MDSFNPRGSAAHDRSPLTLFYFESLTVIVGSHANCSSYSEVTLKEYFVVEEIVCFSVKKKELVTFGMFLLFTSPWCVHRRATIQTLLYTAAVSPLRCLLL